LACALDIGHDALMNAAARLALEHVGRHTPDADAAFRRKCEQLVQPIVGALTDAKFLHATRAQGFEDWIDPVDDHASAPGFSSSCRNAAARSDALKMALIPVFASGRARLDEWHRQVEFEPLLLASQGQANWMKQRLAFCPGLFADTRSNRAKRLLVGKRTRLGEFIRQRRNHGRAALASARMSGLPSEAAAE
jgi:hypothetical protein